MNSVENTSLLQQTKKIAESTRVNTAELDHLIKQLTQTADDNAIDRVVSLYNKTILQHEQHIWQQDPSDEEVEQYQNSFKVLEKIHELRSTDERYNFKIVIPIADRPQHLKQCLDSLLTLCQNYQYGGFKNGTFCKISVLIADDSRDEKNIQLHERYCAEFKTAGLLVEYFGLAEQLALVNAATTYNIELDKIISNVESIDKPSDFSHKGASIMRNITYLKLNRDINKNTDRDNTLIYFIDSDQEFCINTTHSDNQYAINYFHYLNDIFKTQDVAILTGKVVGDPPVSPSVMAGNFQQDIQKFLRSMAELNPDETCQFHQHLGKTKDDASYHDMADLFGFSNKTRTFDYHCTLKNNHSNAECLHDFSNKLSHFFYGEHPTRKTYFNYDAGFSRTTAARTVYTGNYIIKPDALNYFIPFATLKLRMAGPVLGRLLKSRLQQQFVSANLPMLHNRTVASTGQSEFRPGVKNNTKGIDLGNEFIRQFYGDVLLFSMEEITSKGLTLDDSNKEKIKTILDKKYQTIKHSYIEKHYTILQLKTQINKLLHNKKNWWNDPSAKSRLPDNTLTNVSTFLHNIQKNFDENTQAYREITLTEHADKHLEKILHAILHYHDDMISWKNFLNS